MYMMYISLKLASYIKNNKIPNHQNSKKTQVSTHGRRTKAVRAVAKEIATISASILCHYFYIICI